MAHRNFGGILKALDCGTGTDAATMTGGRATIRESLSGAAGTKKRRRTRFTTLEALLRQARGGEASDRGL